MKEKMRSGTVYWITGLSGAGKTTVGTMVYEYLKKKKPNVVRLDGDMLRQVFANMDYSMEGRKKLSFEYSRLCRMLSDQNIDVVISVISMFDAVRDWNRQNIPNYKEIYLEVDMEELIRRNQKGLYKDNNWGMNNQVYGINLNAELPKSPDITIKNYGLMSPEDTFKEILNHFLL